MMCVDKFDLIYFFKEKTAYEMRISDWSSVVCSSDLSFLASLGPVVDRKQGPVKFLQHVGDTFITLMTEANIGLAHAMRHILTDIAACGQNQDRKSVVSGKSASVRVDLVGSRFLQKNTTMTDSIQIKNICTVYV